MKTEITPERLLEEFNYCQKLNNARLTILSTHLLAEHFIHKLCSICSIDSGASIDKRIDALVAGDIITEMQGIIVRLIYKIRNKLIHNLDPDVQEINRFINELKVDPQTDSCLINAWNNLTPWSRLNAIAFPTIFKLYLKSLELENKDRNYRMELKINEDSSFGFTVYKRIESK